MNPQPACLRVETVDITPPPPRRAGVPFWDAPWIAPQLHQLLFEPMGDGVPNTYLILDATLRTNVTGLFDLDSLPVPVRCLFQGEAERDFAQTAPYLIDLTLPQTGPTSFHRSLFLDHWDKGMGIFLRSAAPMDAIWSHFRKFTLIRGATGRSMFFRFWETNALFDYFSAVAALPQRAKDLFCLKSGAAVDLIVGHADAVSRDYAIWPDLQALSQAEYSRGTPRLLAAEEQALYRGLLRRYAKQIERRLPDRENDMAPAQREAMVFDCVCRMQARGIRKLDQITAQVEWELRAWQG